MTLMELKYCARRAKLDIAAARTQADYIVLLTAFLARNPNPVVDVEPRGEGAGYNDGTIVEDVVELIKKNMLRAKECEEKKNYDEASGYVTHAY